MGEKVNEVAKKKLSLLLRDIKTINCASISNQQPSLAIELTTADREHSFLVKTSEEKKQFITSLSNVDHSHKNFHSKKFLYFIDDFLLSKNKSR